MGVTTYNDSVDSPIAPSRLFQAMFVDSHNLFPEVVPALVKSIDILEGDGGAGTIKKINYVEGETAKYIKNRIDEIDGAKLVCKYTMIEGDELGEKLESVRYEVALEGKAGGAGCICKVKIEFHTKGDFTVGEEEFKKGKDKWMGLMKPVEAHLAEHPSLYAA